MSNTTVPIPPIAKGSLTKLWVGVGAALLIAGGGAWLSTADAATGACGPKAFAPEADGVLGPDVTASGLRIQTVKKGQGPTPTDTDMVLINYKGSLPGKEAEPFDANQRVPMEVTGVVPGFSEALKMMQRGGSYKVCIPPALAYGATPPPNSPIPANATLLFDIDLVDFRSTAEIQAAQQQMQQMQQQGGGQMPPPPQP